MLFATIWACAVAAVAVEVRDIPSPRPAGWVTDLTGAMKPPDVSRLNALGDRVKAETGGELAVVLVPSIGGRDPRRFATDLFNAWGLGSRQRNDGVLVFVALGDRAAEIVLGDGLDDAGRTAAADVIMQEHMVPRFKAGDPSGAVVAGAVRCAERILGLKEAGPLPATPSAPLSDRLPPWWPWAAGAGGAGLLPAMVWGIRAWLRGRPRDCSKCGQPMVRLGEQEDDAHLEAKEKVEERIESVDYDVWACRSCGGVVKFRWDAWFSRYHRCPRCRARTRGEAKTTLRAATASSGGLVRIDEKCENCDYRNSYTRSTPTLSDSSSSSSSSSSGFGGGSSSGGGASGRW